MTPEGRTKKLVKEYLARKGAFQFWPVPVGYGKQTVDCLSCWKGWNGQLVAIECKREGLDKPTPRQAAVMKEMRKAGARTWLVTLEEGSLKWIALKD